MRCTGNEPKCPLCNSKLPARAGLCAAFPREFGGLSGSHHQGSALAGKHAAAHPKTPASILTWAVHWFINPTIPGKSQSLPFCPPPPSHTSPAHCPVCPTVLLPVPNAFLIPTHQARAHSHPHCKRRAHPPPQNAGAIHHQSTRPPPNTAPACTFSLCCSASFPLSDVPSGPCQSLARRLGPALTPTSLLSIPSFCTYVFFFCPLPLTIPPLSSIHFTNFAISITTPAIQLVVRRPACFLSTTHDFFGRLLGILDWTLRVSGTGNLERERIDGRKREIGRIRDGTKSATAIFQLNF